VAEFLYGDADDLVVLVIDSAAVFLAGVVAPPAR
jgi:hypothetical protein